MSNLNINTSNSIALNTQKEITMTSLEIVDFINTYRQEQGNTTVLRHSDFMAKVPQVLGEEGVRNFSDTYIHPQNGQTYPCFNFPKREACLMAMSYSYELQAQIFDRMTALEQQLLLLNRPSYMIDDPVERAKKWIEETTAKQEAETKLAEAQQVIAIQAPKADVYDIIASKDCTYTITVTAKLLKMRPKDLTEWLLTNGWMYGKTASTYKPRAQHDRNHLQLVANAYGTQVRVTSKGLVWLARQLKVDLDLDEV